MDYQKFKIFALASIIAISLIQLQSCNRDESEDIEIEEPSEPNIVIPDEPEDQIESDNPENFDEPNSSDENGNYYIPSKDELYGAWKCYWDKCETYTLRNGSWKRTSTEIRDESQIASDQFKNYSTFPYQMGLLKDAYGDRMIWGWSVDKLDEINSNILNKVDTTISDVQISYGGLSGNVYKWSYYEDMGERKPMLVIEIFKNNYKRWDISEFDGDSFLATPSFYDRPSSVKVEGDWSVFYSYRFRRYEPNK